MSDEKFPTLAQMGVEDVHDIESYTTRIEGDVDVLKIYYHRHQGQWVAKSKKFKFAREHTNVPSSESLVPFRAATESSPYFKHALQELDQLVAVEADTKSKKERLLAELEHLDKVVSRKIEDLRYQIEEL